MRCGFLLASVVWTLACDPFPPECDDNDDCGVDFTCVAGSCQLRPSPPPDPGALTCGDVSLQCGCHVTGGSVVFPGQHNPATACDSGFAEIFACSGDCGGGNIPFGAACTCDGPQEGEGEPNGTCADLPGADWFGDIPCTPLSDNHFFVAGELVTFWGTSPSLICNYDGNAGGQGPCGPLAPGNAFYCGADDSISTDFNFLNQQFFAFGDFAPVTILAHEWGHLNQHDLGLLQGSSNKALELHADCQAGIFAAYEADIGNLSAGDVEEAFGSLCAAGDPATSPWFQPGAHGTCEERLSAFQFGFSGAQQQLSSLCSGRDQLSTMRSICE